MSSQADQINIGQQIEFHLAGRLGFDRVDAEAYDLVGCRGTRIQVKGAMRRLRAERRRGRLTFWEDPLKELLANGGVYLIVIYEADPLRIHYLEERTPPEICAHCEGWWESVDHRNKGRRARRPWSKVVEPAPEVIEE
jgi:hypothetical protein